jgi:hypothetical protein
MDHYPTTRELITPTQSKTLQNWSMDFTYWGAFWMIFLASFLLQSCYYFSIHKKHKCYK